MVGQLSDRLTEDDDQDDRVAIEPLRLMEYLERPEQHDKALRRIASNLRDKDCVLFVSHWMKKRHWVTFKVDINRAQITYADGIPDNPRPRELLKRLTGWLNTEFKKTFKALDPGNIMRHGIQDDFYNCGIVAVNAIEYELFKSEVWTSQKKVFHRVRWFNDLSRAFFKQIGQDLDAIQHNSIPRGILELLNPTSSKHMSMDISTILNPVSSISRSCMHISSLSQSDSNASTQTSSLDSSAHIQLLSSTSDTSMPILSPDPSSRMHISSLMNPPSTSESSTSSQLSLKRPGSPIVRSHNQDASVNELDDPPDESSDFALTEEEEEEDADSVVTAQTDDEFYAASSKGLGVVKSSIWAREQNLRFQRTEGQNGSKDPKHYACMRKLLIKARKLDPHAEVITAKLIRHSKCGKNHKLDVPYKISNFRKHVKQHCNGKGNTAGAGSRSIDSFFKPLGGIALSKDQSTSQNTKSSQTPRHCPGLSEADHRGIGLLLDRTGALGGGAPSVTVLSKRLYGCSYKKLSLRRKRAVKMAQ
ncbi:hypothetical protein EV360DRAFT_90574 [Lentinula raphanica]|nr:hypothetical protein EV360DRAFT_90574 [Lentinula raphanica]